MGSAINVIKSLMTSFATTDNIPKESLEALIVTIPSPGKSTENPDNYRPISLLNSDIKIYSKILATRISQYSPKLVHKDQVGFVEEWQASNGAHRFINLILRAECTRRPSLLLPLDVEKAFDRDHWIYLREVLIKFVFKDTNLSAILGLYPLPSARDWTSGLLSNGTRQGCLLS